MESQDLSLPLALSPSGCKRSAQMNCYSKLNSESGDPDFKTNRNKEKEEYSLGFGAATNNDCLLFADSPAGEAGQSSG